MIHVPGRVGMEECSLDFFKFETNNLFFLGGGGGFWLGTGADFFPSA